SRRKFLQTSGLASASMMLPNLLKAFQNSSPIAGNKILVVIQLSGGNDGLNTVIPFRNDVYYKSRPVIGIGADQVLKLNDEMGLNPVMTKMADMYHNGTLAVLNNVGY